MVDRTNNTVEFYIEAPDGTPILVGKIPACPELKRLTGNGALLTKTAKKSSRPNMIASGNLRASSGMTQKSLKTELSDVATFLLLDTQKRKKAKKNIMRMVMKTKQVLKSMKKSGILGDMPAPMPRMIWAIVMKR